MEKVQSEFLLEREFAVSTRYADALLNSNVAFLFRLISHSVPFSHVDLKEDCALLTETTHQKVRYTELDSQQKRDCDTVREAEFRKLKKYKCYDVVDLKDVETGSEILMSMMVNTLKKKPDGVREFKAQMVARGDQDTCKGVETSTTSCPADSMH
uniref:Uncharacterized protein n=1 Tax=Chromera velia CCMP2878 TaxID=1169474 RepID=A0A0G4G112_9ALVE|eukprot:Cvel_19617.t1-p1 / transcript=Cvel_19617.t1 / gene=Cvel_19617 / organism=Chromera_velia_CCMP2878 / gene_product=hypothetical protein / transcript_product=hypothetical protein / location=Cvel_scaffold1706:27604-28065(+) / protein_length=154 / sequence_SO=supercontig / SO=protein_coding / is_pseudo=false